MPRPSSRVSSPTVPGFACWLRVGSLCGSPGSASFLSGRWQRLPPWSSFGSGRSRSGPISMPPTTRSPSSADASTAFRSPSSSPRLGSRCCRCPSSSFDSSSGWRFWPGAAATCQSVSAPCGRRSSGATTCARRKSRRSSAGWRSSRAGGLCRRSRRSVGAISTSSSRSSTRALFGATTAASRCSRRFASTQPSGSPSAVRPTGWRERLRPEWDNFRAVFAWSLESGEFELGLRLAGAVSFAWLDRNLLAEGNRLFEALVPAARDSDEAVMAKALFAWGMIASVQSDWARTKELGEEALEIFRRRGDVLGIAWTLTNLAVVPLEYGRAEEARAMLDEAAELYRGAGSEGGQRRIGHLYAQLAAETGDTERARKELRESAERSLASGEDFSAATTLHSLGDVELTDGAIDAAAAAYAEALSVAWSTGAQRVVCYSLAGLAAVAAERGQLEEAAFLWGFVERYEERLTFTLRRRSRYAERLDPAAKAHPERWQAGRDLDVGAAVEYALSLDAD